MQAQVLSSPRDTETFTDNVSVDLNNLTIEIFESTATLTPSGLGYSFEIRNDFPNELVEEASDEEVQFYSQNSEIIAGRYDLCTGTISMTYTEISNLTWNLTQDVSTATTISTLFVSQN